MITTGIDKRVKVQQIIQNQLPEFLVSESPKAVDFLKQYYISQEYQGGPIDLTDNLDQYIKLDNLTPEVVVGETKLTSGITTTATIVNVSSRDDIQGGELMFRNWQQAKRYDNYGKAVGDDNGQPQWINELGTLIIFPSIEAWGYKLVVSGQGMRVILNFKGEGYK